MVKQPSIEMEDQSQKENSAEISKGGLHHLVERM